MSAPPRCRPSDRPRREDSPASLEDILGAALKAFATHGYDGVALRTLNRELGVSHNALNGRFGSKEALWYATVDWAFQPLVLRLATAFDPTVTDPLDQLRITMRTFLEYSAERPELLGLMNIEGPARYRAVGVRVQHIHPTRARTGAAFWPMTTFPTTRSTKRLTKMPAAGTHSTR
jgi:AcrR family transcriptional regulator